MNDYVIQVKTNHDMGSADFIRSFVQGWFERLPKELHPDRFGASEPARLKMAELGVDAAIQMWLKSKIPVVLKRVANPKFQTSGSWRAVRGLDARPFPWSYTVWLDSKAGDIHALNLFRFLIEQLRPAFGSITTYEDKKKKHFLVTREKGAVVEKYVGLDIGEKLPGIYWATYFGTWSLDKIGRSKFNNLPVFSSEKIEDGVLLVAYKECNKALSEEAKCAEHRVIEALGEKYFFKGQP